MRFYTKDNKGNPLRGYHYADIMRQGIRKSLRGYHYADITRQDKERRGVNMNMIETQNLTKIYGDFTAVSRLNLHISQRKCLWIF